MYMSGTTGLQHLDTLEMPDARHTLTADVFVFYELETMQEMKLISIIGLWR